MADAEYTERVDSGSYTNFAHDCAGYGLAAVDVPHSQG